MSIDNSESDSLNEARPDRKVTLRPVHHNDVAEETLLLQIYASSRSEELALTNWDESQREIFIRMQFAAQSLHYRSYYPNAEHQFILLDDAPVGRIYIDRRASEIRILDITLLSEYRSLGIGGWLIEELLAEASTTSKTVTIYVDNYNRSQRLFSRLGFTIIENDDFNVLMEWRPAKVSIDAPQTWV